MPFLQLTVATLGVPLLGLGLKLWSLVRELSWTGTHGLGTSLPHLEIFPPQTRQDGMGISAARGELGRAWTGCELQAIFRVWPCFGEWGELCGVKEPVLS